MKAIFIKIWEKWKKIAKIIGHFNTKVFVTLTYFILIAPLGFLFRLFGWNPLDNSWKNRQRTSNWRQVKVEEPDFDSMTKQS